ncbi:hypothetical protein V6N13_081079 [Hibiscus sabdariffa]
MQNLSTSIRNLEIQIGQIASALSIRSQGALRSDTVDDRHNHSEQCKVVTLRSRKQCEAEISAKQHVQCHENEPIEGPKETSEKEEAESSNASHQTNANPQDDVEDKLESILRMEVAQRCQEVDNDVSSDGMIENTEEEALEEVIYAQQLEPLGLANRKIELPKPSIEEGIVLGHRVTKRGLEVY